MEGTRHEKVALVVVSYIIGFITAFIAFGLVAETPQQDLSLSTSKPTHKQVLNKVIEKKANVGFGEDGLYSITKQKSRIIAADKVYLGASVIGTDPERGFYYKIIDAESSRDGNYIYYCEQLTEDSPNCDPYVYALVEDAVHPVKKDGELFAVPVDEHESLWTEEGVLMVNGFESRDNTRPWELSTITEVFVQ